MKTIEIKAGERKRIIHKFSNSLPANYKFDVAPKVIGGSVSGIIEISGSNWIFPKEATRQDLGETNMVDKGVMDTFYGVYVTPDEDVHVTLAGSYSSRIWIYIAIAIAVVLIAVVPIILNS